MRMHRDSYRLDPPVIIAMRIAPAALLAALLLLPQSLQAADAPPGAASCSGCHPANRWVDTSVPRLSGRNPADLAAAMDSFKSGQLPSTVMGRIAKGFT